MLESRWSNTVIVTRDDEKYIPIIVMMMEYRKQETKALIVVENIGEGTIVVMKKSSTDTDMIFVCWCKQTNLLPNPKILQNYTSLCLTC